MTEKTTQTVAQTNLEKLKTGCLLRSLQKETAEPENIALGQVSKELRFLQRQSQYVAEITRVLKEMRLTTTLIKQCRTIDVPEGVSRQELLAYYQGTFLTLVHQMKDKVAQFVYLMTEKTIPNKPSTEDDISIVVDLLEKKKEILQEIGITDFIQEWNQDNPKGGIAVALRKRTVHHHRVTGLTYDKDFLNLGFTDIASQQSFQQNLSDYGKAQIEKMRTESEERLFSNAYTKSQNTLNEIEKNIENISSELIRYFKIPIAPQEMQAIFTAYMEMLGSFDAVNRCTIDKVIEPYKTMLNQLMEQMRSKYGDTIVAVYLVGSLGRGEYEEGYSDTALYIILNLEEEVGQTTKRSDFFKITLRFFSEKEFTSQACFRHRLIAKIDGLLLYGKDIAKEEKLPKAGLLLAVALYDDILEILDEATEWKRQNSTATPIEISAKSKILAKRLIDFMYAVTMSNKPQFTPSRKERAEFINQMFPSGDKNVVEILMEVSRHGVGELESFSNMIEGFRPQAETNLKKLLEIKNHIEKSGD